MIPITGSSTRSRNRTTTRISISSPNRKIVEGTPLSPTSSTASSTARLVARAHRGGHLRHLTLARRTQLRRNITPVFRQNVRRIAARNHIALAQPPNLIRATLKQSFVVRDQRQSRTSAPQFQDARQRPSPMKSVSAAKRMIQNEVPRLLRHRIARPQPHDPRRMQDTRPLFKHPDNTAVGRREMRHGEFDHANGLLLQRDFEGTQRLFAEKHHSHFFHRARLIEETANLTNRDLRRLVHRIPVDASADRRERNAFEIAFRRQLQTLTVAGRQFVGLALFPATVNRAYRVENESCSSAAPLFGDHRFAGGALAHLGANAIELGHHARSGRPMNRAIHSGASREPRIRRVHDRVGLDERDIALFEHHHLTDS